MEHVPPPGMLWSDEEESEDDNELSSGSDESEWGTVKENFCMEDILRDEKGDVGEEKQLYIPESVCLFNSTEKPELPQLPVECIPIGCNVWVVDEEDVQLLLKEYWDDSYSAACNGRLCGSVVRHSHNLTLVLFYDEHLEMKFSLSLPRVCLSKEPIEAYDHSPQGSSQFVASYFVFDNLSPCVGWFSTDAVNPRIDRQFYESLSVMEVQVSPHSFSQFGSVQERISKGAYEEALLLLDEVLAESLHRVDALVLRSRTNVFLGRCEEALKDAQEVIQLEPRWVRGYLAAARALSGLGKFDVASSNIHRALLLLPHSQELRKIQKLNDFMNNLQGKLLCDDLVLHLDFQYSKRLVSRRQFKESEVVYKEDLIILAMESLFSTHSSRCCVCLKTGGEIMRVPVDSTGSTSEEFAYYCSVECQQRSSLFFSMEFGRHRISIERAQELIFCNFKGQMSQTPLDMACMVIRLFLMICVTHHRLSLQRHCLRRPNDGSTSNTSTEEEGQNVGLDVDGPLSLQIALRHLGIYPLVTDELSTRVHEEMRVLYNILTTFFSEEERQIYSLALFCALYEYVQTFAIGVDIKATKTRLYYLPRLMGAVDRVKPLEANCNVVTDEDGTNIALVASRNISAGELLSIPAWDSHTIE